MNEILKNKNRSKIIALSVISVLIAIVTVIILFDKIKEDKFITEVAAKESDNALEWASKINVDTVFQENDLGTIRYNYKTIKESKFVSVENKKAILDKINQCNIRIKSGVKIFDEFDNYFLKEKTKYIIIRVDSCLNYKKPFVTEEYSGYRNSLNRKADKLYKKYQYKDYRWTKPICTKIINGEVSLGMTTAMVKEAWGRPNDINRTVGSWGVHEQWVYSANYLYFEDGILTSWQD